jgi:TIR domain-containing protein
MPSLVFISHSSKDRETADAICAYLESAGIKCWIAPRDIEPGATWTKGIMQGLDACRVFILVFSEHANDSDHVQREVAKAFSSGLAVIPFRIKDVLPNQSLSYFLDTVQWLDASAPPLQKHLGTLSEQVKKLLVDETTRQPPKRLGPEKISVARLPVTGSDVFGREEDIAFLMHGQTSISMSLQSLPGPGSGSPRSSTIGSDRWLLNIIEVRRLCLVGHSTGRAQVEVLHPLMNFLTRLWLGLTIQIRGLERLGRRVNDWQSSSHIVEFVGSRRPGAAPKSAWSTRRTIA